MIPLADAHGALMTFGFLGTAISLERGAGVENSAKTRISERVSAPRRQPNHSSPIN